ncbi:guided entry of tail-anchored proteins factor 1-like isoform X3 [Gopherus flavomarginatus]|uniref:guided entry of tail-anchored proteins factor 1-like isoform X3 n=1 Tax=Gopherus flavomarginatus TaxID=286002 RepID=UPI0021CBC41E|nr:guided entry of tail-anchored proteins factor 1-like isoform X3 [Gopherus flavomarginatus]
MSAHLIGQGPSHCHAFRARAWMGHVRGMRMRSAGVQLVNGRVQVVTVVQWRLRGGRVMAESGAWLLVLSSVFLCNLLKILLPFCSSIISRLLQKDAEQESQMRADIHNMKQELSTISMMDEFARYARLERKINKMTDKLKTHVKARTAQLAKIKWVINIVFYILQAALMISLIWKYYSEPVTVLPSKWLAPMERLVAFPTGVAGGVGITCWLVVCNKVVAIMLHPFS